MSVYVEKMRFDIAETQHQASVVQKWEPRKFLLSLILATAGAGAGIGNLIWAHREPAPPMFPPGTVITIPPAKP